MLEQDWFQSMKDHGGPEEGSKRRGMIRARRGKLVNASLGGYGFGAPLDPSAEAEAKRRAAVAHAYERALKEGISEQQIVAVLERAGATAEEIKSYLKNAVEVILPTTTVTTPDPVVPQAIPPAKKSSGGMILGGLVLAWLALR